MGLIIALVAKNSNEISQQQVVKVIDQSDVFAGKFHDIKNLKFEPTKQSFADVKKDLAEDENLSALIILPNFTIKDAVEIYSKKKPGIVVTNEIENQMNDIALNEGLVKNHIDPAILKSIKPNISLTTKEITENGEKKIKP